MVLPSSACISFLGTKDSGIIKREIRARAQKVGPLIKEYNKCLAQFTGDNKPAPLPTDKHLDELLLRDSALWELDRYSCTDKWARDRNMQNAFNHMYNVVRAKEEVTILLTQSQRHINWFISEIHNVTKALGILKIEHCELGRRLLNRGQLAAVILRSWGNHQDIINVLKTNDVCEEALLVTLEGSISHIYLR
jgi:hypothetical protein